MISKATPVITASLLLHAFGFASATAAPKLVTTTTDLAWMAREIAGPDAEVESLLSGTEDPHFVDARPDYIRKVAKADAVCIVGLDLEVGWIPKVLAKSGRAHLQPGGLGYCDTGRRVDVLEKPVGVVDRSLGDVHPSGNPHFWLSPRALSQASLEVVETLARIHPPKADAYRERHAAFQIRMDALLQSGRARLEKAGVTGPKSAFFEYHREFSYFASAFGLQSKGTLEEKPGVPPSAARIASVAAAAKASGVSVMLSTRHAPRRQLSRFEELSGLKVKVVPISVVPHGVPQDYPSLLEGLQDALIEAASANPSK